MISFLLLLLFGMRSKYVERYVARQFRKPTGWGGKMATTIMNVMNKAQYRAIINNIKLHKGENVLDIGFGNGYLLNRLAKHHNSHFYGIEISEDMLKDGAERNKKHIDNGKMKLIFANVMKTPFENDFFDKIYTVNTVYFWSDPAKCFTEIARILKPGGMFLNAIYTKEWLNKISYTKHGFHKYTADELIVCATNNGLENVKIIEIKKNVAYCMIAMKMKNVE